MPEIQSFTEITKPAFLGLGLSFLPKSLLQLSARKLTNQINIIYPGLAERLREVNGKKFTIILSDMPFNALLSVEDSKILCQLISKETGPYSEVTIHGSSEALLSLLEGRCDGDALFFSRALQVEGDTEALLILRNALDNERIFIRDIVIALFGPLSGLASHVATPLEKLGSRLTKDMNWLYHSAISPLVRKNEVLAERLDVLESNFKQMEMRHTILQKRSAGNA